MEIIVTQPNETTLNIEIMTSETSAVCFAVDGSPEAVLDNNNNIVGYTANPEHAILFADFTTDPLKLQRFCELLAANPTTACAQYLATR